MAMAIMPAAVLTAVSLVINSAMAAATLMNGGSVAPILISLGQSALNIYLTLLFVGGITTATEWKAIHTSTAKKILYVFTFPLFMFTYIPISFSAIFAKVEWKPIAHSVNVNLAEYCTRESA